MIIKILVNLLFIFIVLFLDLIIINILPEVMDGMMIFYCVSS